VGDAEPTQLAYYARTAAGYDDAHVHDDDEHAIALHHIAGDLEVLKADSVLDTGCVFDSYRQVADACERVVAVPLTGSGRSALLGSPHVLLCGFKPRK
jgi:hypothetical protein